MQDRSPPARRNHLQRTAGPYIRVNRVTLTLRRSLPLYPDKQTFSESVGMSQRCQRRKWWLVTRPAALLKVGCIRPLPLQTAYLPLFAQEILCHQHVVVVATVLLESILL
jgi:hypothetical protein